MTWTSPRFLAAALLFVAALPSVLGAAYNKHIFYETDACDGTPRFVQIDDSDQSVTQLCTTRNGEYAYKTCNGTLWMYKYFTDSACTTASSKASEPEVAPMTCMPGCGTDMARPNCPTGETPKAWITVECSTVTTTTTMAARQTDLNEKTYSDAACTTETGNESRKQALGCQGREEYADSTNTWEASAHSVEYDGTKFTVKSYKSKDCSGTQDGDTMIFNCDECRKEENDGKTEYKKIYGCTTAGVGSASGATTLTASLTAFMVLGAFLK